MTEKKKKRIIFPDPKTQMDYEYLRGQVLACYLQVCEEDGPQDWEVKDIWKVISFHFREFYKRFKRSPQHIRNEKMRDIIRDIPFIPWREEDYLPVEPLDYHGMLTRYFVTIYEDCSYSFMHFMSGRIREMKYLEANNYALLNGEEELLEDDLE